MCLVSCYMHPFHAALTAPTTVAFLGPTARPLFSTKKKEERRLRCPRSVGSQSFSGVRPLAFPRAMTAAHPPSSQPLEPTPSRSVGWVIHMVLSVIGGFGRIHSANLITFQWNVGYILRTVVALRRGEHIVLAKLTLCSFCACMTPSCCRKQ